MLGFISCLTVAGLASVGLDVEANFIYQSEIVSVGGAIPEVTMYALRWASVFVDDAKVHSLVKTVSTGIDVDFEPPTNIPDDVPNYVPDEFMDKVTAQFDKEVAAGHTVVVNNRDDVWGLTAVGVVDKDHSNFALTRTVNDFSRPFGESINDCTNIEKVRFASVADAYRYMSPYAYMSKVDYTGAYRSVGFASRLWRYHVWEWKGTLLMDLRLMFGHSAGPAQFTELSQAIVRKVKSLGCPGTIGYIDDIITISQSYAENERCHLIVVELSSFLGFKLNPSKVVPPTQNITFLGIQLHTNADGRGQVTASIDTQKISTLTMLCQKVTDLEYLKRSDLEWMVGLMSFCSQVILGSRLFMRQAYSFLHFMKRKRLKRAGPSRQLREEAGFWPMLMELYNGKAVHVVRKVVHTDFFAVDACTKIGMGGYLDGLYFAVTWAEMATWAITDFAPFRDEASSHINYLELYVIYHALHLWGDRLIGCEVLIWTDNTTAEACVRDLWGRSTFIPLLKEIWKLSVKFDVRVKPVPIRSKVNVESDSLSRQDWVTFATSVGMSKAKARALARRDPRAMRELNRLCAVRAAQVADYDDWMLLKAIFDDLWRAYGPFDCDAAADIWGSNTYCYYSWNANNSALVQNWGGMNIYCNPPFSLILEFLVRFLACKMKYPMGTSALFILPVWDGEYAKPFWELVVGHPTVFHIVRRFPAGVPMFTSPNTRGASRRYVGPTKWPVVAVWVPPTPLEYTIDLSLWAPSPALLAVD